jgi:hypothetical protein
MSTTNELLARLNVLRTDNNKAPLKAWKESRAKLELAIAAFDTVVVGNLEAPLPPRDFEASEAELAAQADRAKIVAAKTATPLADGTHPDYVEPKAPKKAKVTKDVKFNDDRKVKQGEVWLTELCTKHNLHPKVARAKLRRLYAGDTKNLPTLMGRWSWATKDTDAIVKLLKRK